MAKIFNLAENTQKKTFHRDPWPDIYASRQSRGTFLTGYVSAIETHQLGDDETPCLVVMQEHVKGLIPLTESGCNTKAQLKKLLDQVITFKVIALDEESNLFTASRSQALEYMANQTWKNIKDGEVRTAVARNVNLRGVIIDVDGIETELPARELSWGWVNNVRDYIEPGDIFDVKIVKADKLNKKLEVSVRELLPDPWPGVVNRYKTGRDNEYVGTVTGIPHFGIFVNLEPGVDMLTKQRRNNIRPELGEKVRVVLTKIDPDNKKIEGYITRRLGKRLQ